MKECVIVIPVYKEDLEPLEEIALSRLFELNIYDNVYFVCPEQLSLTNYAHLFRFKYHVANFDKSYFESTLGYSKLCMSYDFYNYFSDYKYMLIYQLDCYLFRNEIKEWCSKGYDYIGAPIFSDNANWTVFKNKEYCPAVGNGGLSLRKISTFKELTNPNGDFLKYTKFEDPKFNDVAYEDLYFGEWLAPYFDMDKPNWRIASTFALDMNPDIAYNQLKIFDKSDTPMGIHATGKNIRWWKDYLSINEETLKFYEKKYKDFFKLYYSGSKSNITIKTK